MGQLFDPYYKWLGISPDEQPPNHYRLLGVKAFELDPDVIQAAADQRMAHLRTYQTGQYADWSQRLLNEVSAAKICLLSPAKRIAYDRQLREAIRPEPVAEPAPTILVEEDEREPHFASIRNHKRRFPVATIIVGATMMIAVLAVGLLYLDIESNESNAPVAKQSGQPANRDNEAGKTVDVAKQKKPNDNVRQKQRAKEEQGKRAIPQESEADEPSQSAVPPLSGSTAVKASSPNKPSPAKLFIRSDAEQPEPPKKQLRKNKPLRDKSPESQAPDRVEVPPAPAQEEAMKLAHDLYKDEFTKAKTTEDKQAFAKKLLSQATEATSSDAGTFVLLRLARDVSVQASSGESAFAAIDAMSERYLIDALEMKMEALAAFAKKARTPPQHASVAEQATRLVDEASAAGNYAQAVNLSKLVAVEGGLGRSKELVQWAKTSLQELQKKAKLATEFEAAKTTLVTDPNDPAANLTVGTYYAYLQGNWEKALPHLMKGSDADLQTLAKQEIESSPTNLEKQMALADAWWDAAQNAEGLKRLAMLHHAGSWYAKVQTEALSGLSKIKVEKRLEELAKIDREASAAGPKPRSLVPLGKWFSLLASPNELTGWEVGNCRFNYNNRIIDLRQWEMYYPIVAKDASIRAKVRRLHASAIRLIVRNSAQGCYVAQLNPNRWSIIKLTRMAPDVRQAPAWMHQRGDENTLNAISVARNFSDLVFEMGFAVAGNTMTVFFNRQPILQAKDAAFTEGTVGIGTDNANGLFVTDVELLIPKGSLVEDRRAPAGSAKQPPDGNPKTPNGARPSLREPNDGPPEDAADKGGGDANARQRNNPAGQPGWQPPKKQD